MKCLLWALALAVGGVWQVQAHVPDSPLTIEVVDASGLVFREIPVQSGDGSRRSYLQAEKGARYRVRVGNSSGTRVGLVIAVDGRNIISGKRSELARSEPMYVLDAWETEEYSGWRANLDAVNEFYFTQWGDSYAQAFGDGSAKGVIAVAVYNELPPPVAQSFLDDERQRGTREADAANSPPATRAERAQDKSAGTGYGDRIPDRAVRVEFRAVEQAQARHFIKYEWRDTLCRRQLIDCASQNRFWDESTLGFAPPPPRHHPE